MLLRLTVAAAVFLGLWGLFHGTFAYVGGFPSDFSFSVGRFIDLALLYALVPAYFVAVSGLQIARTRAALATFVGRAGDGMELDVAATFSKSGIAVGIALGITWGLFDFRLATTVPQEVALVELVLKFGNATVWGTIGFLLAWRIRTGYLLYKLGRGMAIDLHQLDELRPVGRLASADVFVTMGALALMPLQSLSSPFEWVYYQTGFYVGIAASIVFLVLPMLGVRIAVGRAKQAELTELNARLANYDRADIDAMNAFVSYRQHVRDLPEWPMETKVLSRALAYLVIPPLAWVGAAMVERGVDQLF